MPRYFFNTRIGDELIADPEGEDLRDPDRAWEVARAMIRELLKTEGAERGLLNAILEVTDDEGEIVWSFRSPRRSSTSPTLQIPDTDIPRRPSRSRCAPGMKPLARHYSSLSCMFSDCAPAEKYRRLPPRKATGAGIVHARART